MSLDFTETNIEKCFLIRPDRFNDERGFFQEAYEKEKYKFTSENWVQANWSSSKKNVLRGIHCAKYSKLVTCVKGAIWDVVVDLRVSSPTFKKHFFCELSENNGYQIYVPGGCGHGFLSLVDDSSVFYMQAGFFKTSNEKTYKYDCFGIDWPVLGDYIISHRDINGKVFD